MPGVANVSASLRDGGKSCPQSFDAHPLDLAREWKLLTWIWDQGILLQIIWYPYHEISNHEMVDHEMVDHDMFDHEMAGH